MNLEENMQEPSTEKLQELLDEMAEKLRPALEAFAEALRVALDTIKELVERTLRELAAIEMEQSGYTPWVARWTAKWLPMDRVVWHANKLLGEA